MTAVRVSKPKIGLMADRPAPRRGDVYIATDSTGVFGSTTGGGGTVETYLAFGGQWVLVEQYGPTFTPVISPPAGTTWTTPHPDLGMLVDEDFETISSLHDVFTPVGPHATLSTANPYHGSKHFRDTPVGSTSTSVALPLPENNRQLSVHFHFYLNARPTGSGQILFSVLGGTNWRIVATANGKLRAQIGNNLILPDLGLYTTGVYHSADMLIDASTGTTSLTARMDTLPSQNATLAIPSNDLVKWQLCQGAASSQTVQVDIDQIRISNDPSTYPLGDS